MLAKRAAREASTKAEIQALLARNPGRRPDWASERVAQVPQRACLLPLGLAGSSRQTARWRAAGRPGPAARPPLHPVGRQGGGLFHGGHAPCCEACATVLADALPAQSMRWDWLSNQPAQPPSPADSDPGWCAARTEPSRAPACEVAADALCRYNNCRHMLKPPLLDGSRAPNQLAAWIDGHTMAVHHNILQNLGQVGV